MSSEADAPAEGFVFYQNRKTTITSVLLAAGLLAGSVFAYKTPFVPGEAGNSLVAHGIAAYLGPPIMLVTFLWALYKLFSKKPILVIDAQGVCVSPGGMGTIPWREIADVTERVILGKRFLAVLPRDIERMAASYPAGKARTLRFNQEQMGMAVGIAAKLLPIPLEELLAQVRDYCAKKIRESV